MGRRRKTGVLKGEDGRFWYPVIETYPFRKGDVIWIDNYHGEEGPYEVRAVGRGELLLRPTKIKGMWRERWSRRLTRWWERLTRVRR